LLPAGDSGAAAVGVGSGVASIRFARSGYTIRRSRSHTVFVTASSGRWRWWWH